MFETAIYADRQIALYDTYPGKAKKLSPQAVVWPSTGITMPPDIEYIEDDEAPSPAVPGNSKPTLQVVMAAIATLILAILGYFGFNGGTP
jgi:hypothetical protein